MKSTTHLTVDGYEIFALFPPTCNQDVSLRVKQIMLSTFAANPPPKEPNGTLAIPATMGDNKDGSEPHAP